MSMRRWIDRLPIRWKLVGLTILTSAIVELLAVGIITLYVTYADRVQKFQQTAVQAEILASNLTAPLMFGDVDAVREYLATLKADKSIAAAAAYGVDGRLLASYIQPGASPRLLPVMAPAHGQHYDGASLLVSQPVTRAGTGAGSLYLVVETDTLSVQLARFGGLMLFAIFISLAIAVPVSIRLNAAISSAIRDIAGAAARIKSGDLAVDLPASRRGDEIGLLVATFRQMVASLREMMQEERLRALGQMASGIAHDINNALSPMALHTRVLLESEPNLSERVRSYLETVKRVISDVTITVGRMRDFSRKREPQMTLAPMDLNQLVRQVVDLTRVRWSNMQQEHGFVIGVEIELADDLPVVMGAEGEIREALTNLIFNAVDAMPQGGTLTLRTKAVRMGGEPQTSRPSHVVVEVQDTGVGMDEETRRRCFEPFFTTKGELGTGLGMAMIYGAIQRHSAAIAIESASGKGTLVRLSFMASAALPAAPHPPAASLTPRAGSRLLVVDDNPSVLESMRMVLELDGYDVVEADSGQNGIDIFRAMYKDGKKFAAIITDLGMPHVDGNQVARAVKETAPATPVILLTGWGQQMNADSATPANIDYILGKPPDLDQLRAVLAQCR
jgi:signal transduction histidine kinase/ActR/RegA family two-component response regulator